MPLIEAESFQLEHPIRTNSIALVLVDEGLIAGPELRRAREIGQFLTDLAVLGEVAAGTQNQALCSLLFLYGKVLGRDLKFIQRFRAKASHYRPVVLSQREVLELLGHMRGCAETMFRLMYGSGLDIASVVACALRIYTHVMNRPGLTVTSPLDRIATFMAVRGSFGNQTVLIREWNWAIVAHATVMPMRSPGPRAAKRLGLKVRR